MKLKIYTCSKCVGENHRFIKFGKTPGGKQRYQCSGCKKTSVLEYDNVACKEEINKKIVLLTKEGLGIRSTARVLKISPTTLLKRLLQISQAIKPPIMSFKKKYQVDEICTYVRTKSNRIWIAYGLETITKKVAYFSVGKRNNNTLLKVIHPLILSKPVKINTDRLKHYAYLIPKTIHQTKKYGTNTIERKNLSMRTHLKRLNRRTICFSKSLRMLNAILKIYFWAEVF